jgi:hypothetical protein
MGHMKDFDRRIRQGGDDAMEAVSQLLPRWISVSERLPEPHEKVIALDDCGNPHIAAQHPFEEDTPFARGTRSHRLGSLWTNEWRAISGVDYWMPLPEPPAT